MSGLNLAVFSGNVGKNPRLLNGTSQEEVTTAFSVGVNDDYFDEKTKKWEERTIWVDCKTKGDKLDRIVTGRLVTVQGKIRAGSYEGDSGMVPTLKINNATVTYLGKKPDGSGDGDDSSPPNE